MVAMVAMGRAPRPGMNWKHNPHSEQILAIMLAVAIIGSGLWSLAMYVADKLG